MDATLIKNVSQHTKPTVLYVDDEQNNLATFNATFRRYYKVLTATSAREAIGILSTNTVDLIITDQRMPEMTGVQFLEAIIPEYPSPTKMILTGFSDVEAITKAINTGSVLRYITKPWNESELKQIIDMGIKIHELENNSKMLLKNLEDEMARQKKAISLFEKYVTDKAIIQQALQVDHITTQAHGEYRIVSTLFLDIRNFTKLSNTLNPKDLVNYLNEYFSIMIDCVVKNHGAIYQLVGDGLWAIFGWPVSSIYNQRNAVFCALDMLEALKSFNKTIGAKMNYETVVGIGISTGEAVVGQIQSDSFTNSVVIGESVDLAAQIENLTRTMPNTILLNETTCKTVKEDVEVEEIEAGQFGNKTYPLYKVIKKIDNSKK